MGEIEDLERIPGTPEVDGVLVRQLTSVDLPWLARIDRQRTGRDRTEYYRLKLGEVERDTGLKVSLAAELDREPAGFLIGRLYYGEFGLPEPVAILDSLGVAPEFAGRRVGAALMQQLCTNLRGLGIETVQTQVEWNQHELLRFFEAAGFRPAPRWSLELRLESLNS